MIGIAAHRLRLDRIGSIVVTGGCSRVEAMELEANMLRDYFVAHQ